MFARTLWIPVTIIFVFICPLFCIYSPAQRISQECMGCICEVTSGCNTTVGCDGPVCGPFYITKAYWIDAGLPTLSGESSRTSNDDTYRACVNDVYCAARTVQNYMIKFRQDCTGNGVIDCDDYVRLHRFGVSGCTTPLHSVYENIYKLCISNFSTQ